MSFNPFAEADAAAPVTTKKKAKKDDKLVFMEPGLLTYAGICAAEKAIKGLKTVHEGPLKAKILDRFVSLGIAAKRHPDSYKAIENNKDGDEAEATVILSTKGQNVALTDAETEQLDRFKIPYETADEVVETYIFNPDLIKDQAVMKMVADALSNIEGLPSGLIQKQSSKKKVVSDKTVDAICSLPAKDDTDVKIIKSLLQMVTTVAIRATVKGTNEGESALKIVKTLVGKPKVAE
jgi:uncharacterized protein YuzB (UPF0349 family)